ncbi:MAG: hypothetical protein ACTJLM_04270 [Ehrlichia sp.]
MFAFLKKGATVVIKQAAKVAMTPTTTELPHQRSIGKMISSVLPNTSQEKNFDLDMHNRTYKLGIELPGSTRLSGHQNEVALKVPSYKLPLETLQKFAAWQEQGKEGDVEETKSGIAESLLNPSSAAKESINRKAADKHFDQLKELDTKLESIGGKVIVESTKGSYKNSLTVEIDVSDKSPEDIREQVRLVLHSLDIKDEKLVKTFSERLYKSSMNTNVTSPDQDIIQKKRSTPNADRKKQAAHASPDQSTMDDTSDTISSHDFSLTDPGRMPYTKSSVQNPDMLLEQQRQLLTRKTNESKFQQHVTHGLQKELEEIAGGLSQDITAQTDDQTQCNVGSKKTQSKGKIHAR